MKLFLGFALDDLLQRSLAALDPRFVALFTQGGDYLEEIVHDNQRYLGKYLMGELYQDLELLEANVRTIGKRLCIDPPPLLVIANG